MSSVIVAVAFAHRPEVDPLRQGRTDAARVTGIRHDHGRTTAYRLVGQTTNKSVMYRI
jgi:hypothetical protein